MPPSLQLGQIVWAEMADANGIRKSRPAVILTPTDRINASDPLAVVAITSRLPQPLPADHILLPWHPQKHPRTGLNRKCAAVCSWIGQIMASDIQHVPGLVPGPILLEIVSRVAAMQPPQPSEDKGPTDQQSSSD